MRTIWTPSYDTFSTISITLSTSIIISHVFAHNVFIKKRIYVKRTIRKGNSPVDLFPILSLNVRLNYPLKIYLGFSTSRKKCFDKLPPTSDVFYSTNKVSISGFSSQLFWVEEVPPLQTFSIEFFRINPQIFFQEFAARLKKVSWG